MTTFVALYRGKTVGEARLIAVSAAPILVQHVATELLLSTDAEDVSNDPVLDATQQGRQQALRLVARPNKPETENSTQEEDVSR